MIVDEDLARISRRLKEIHDDILGKTGVDEKELLEAVAVIQEMDDATEDMIALNTMLTKFESLREPFQAWYMRHALDVRPGVNVYHPTNASEHCLAIYIPDCLYLHLGYYNSSSIRNRKERTRDWYYRWEWRPPADIIKRLQKEYPEMVKNTKRTKGEWRFWRLRSPEPREEKKEDDSVLQRD